MKKRKGLVFQTFLFSSLLIIMVIALCFGILYSVMPRYYLTQKTQTLELNAAALLETITPLENTEELIESLAAFATRNNSTLYSYGKDGEFLPNYSTPFIFLSEEERAAYSVSIKTRDSYSSDFYISEIQENEGSTDREPGESAAETVHSIEENPANGDPVFFSQGDGMSMAWEYDINTAEGLPASTLIPTFQTDHPISITTTVTLENPTIQQIVISNTLQPISEASAVLISLLPYIVPLCILIGMLLSYALSELGSLGFSSMDYIAAPLGAISGSLREFLHFSSALLLLYVSLRWVLFALREGVEKKDKLLALGSREYPFGILKTNFPLVFGLFFHIILGLFAALASGFLFWEGLIQILEWQRNFPPLTELVQWNFGSNATLLQTPWWLGFLSLLFTGGALAILLCIAVYEHKKREPYGSRSVSKKAPLTV